MHISSLQKSSVPISAGELGTTAAAVVKRRPYIFKRAAPWRRSSGLLDEAEVLLEQRSLPDIQRYALVRVFLRTPRYYHGLMFLTTNRVWGSPLGKAATPQAPLYSLEAVNSWVGKERNGREVGPSLTY
jgi:hypothetical protein